MRLFNSGLLAALLIGSVSAASAQTAPTDTWTGAVSTAWATPANWSAGRVPLATDDVLINGPSLALFNPYVTSVVVAHHLTLAAGAVLYLDNTGTLQLGGDFTNLAGSVLGRGRGTLSLVGANVQHLNGPASTSFRNLRVGAAGAITAAPVAVERGLTVYGVLSVGTGQPFTLLSTSTGPGYVVNAGGSVSGPVSVQRYIDPGFNPALGYRHLSSPVTTATFATLQGPGYTPVFNTAYNTASTPGATRPFPTVFGYDQSRLVSQAAAQNISVFDKGFYSPASSDPMVQGYGYTVNLPGAANGVSGQGTVVTFTGPLFNGNLTVPVAQGGATGQGYNLLGNPYPSPVDWNKITTNPGTTNIYATLYVYKSTGQYSGTYASYVNGVGTNGGTNVLPLAQAFFVYGNSPGTLAFNNAARLSSDSTLMQRSTQAVLNGSRLLVSGGDLHSEAVVYFDAQATVGMDAKYDALMIPVGALRLTSQVINTKELLAINALPLLGRGDVHVPLIFSAATAGTYQVNRTEGTLPAGFGVYLVNRKTGFVQDLSGKQTAQVTLTDGDSPAGRWELLYSAAAPLATLPSLATLGAALYPNPASGSVHVQLSARNESAVVELRNMLGQTVLRRELANASGAGLDLDLHGLAPGVYVVRLRTASGGATQKLLIN